MLSEPADTFSSVYTVDGDRLLATTLSEPGVILLGHDRTTLHEVIALRPGRIEEPGHRDVLTRACTAR